MIWRPHFKNLKNECKVRLNLLKILRHQKWEADRESLINIWKVSIISKTEYNSIVHMSAKKRHTEDYIQNIAICITIGAFHTCPIISTQVDTNELPLNLSRKQLSVRYLTYLAANRKWSNFPTIYPNQTHQPIKDMFSFPLAINKILQQLT